MLTRRVRFWTVAAVAVAVTAGSAAPAVAEVAVNNLFTDHMVLQRDHENPVWGTAAPGEAVTVSIGEQTQTATADESGNWHVKLTPLEVLPDGESLTLKIAGSEGGSIEISDVLVGEVWVCSGQSNMQWSVRSSNHAELEIASANYPNIRLVSVPQVGTQEPQTDFNGSWSVCSPQPVADFSAVGYFFGRQLHNTLGVPVGLIDNAWGGSAAEAWIPKEKLAERESFAKLLADWSTREKNYDYDAITQQFQASLEKWKADSKAAKAAGKPAPRRPRRPGNVLAGNQRPGNIYNGVLNVCFSPQNGGYGIAGVIWYQGESNAGRAEQYRELFPLMIETWRDRWGQGDFPFYWVQLADFQQEIDYPIESSWAELREAQTMTQDKLPNTGEAVIIDVGEGRDIHPRNKQVPAMRLARLALADVYGLDIASRSPRFESAEPTGEAGEIAVTFKNVSRGGLYAFDTPALKGFAIAEDDGKFFPAEGRIVGKNKVVLTSEQVENPTQVRYGWGYNPVVNLYDRNGLPVTPFRSDTRPGVTAGKTSFTDR